MPEALTYVPTSARQADMVAVVFQNGTLAAGELKESKWTA